MTDGTAVWAIRDKRNRHNVGDIVIKDTTPKDYEYLIAMDGQTFDTAKYPFLAELYPSGTLPNLNDNRFLEGAETAGKTKEAGLPNIYGAVTAYTWLGQESPKHIGALKSTHSNTEVAMNGTQQNQMAFDVIEFLASDSNPIYAKSDTVQPKSYTVKYYVCYA